MLPRPKRYCELDEILDSDEKNICDQIKQIFCGSRFTIISTEFNKLYLLGQLGIDYSLYPFEDIKIEKFDRKYFEDNPNDLCKSFLLREIEITKLINFNNISQFHHHLPDYKWENIDRKCCLNTSSLNINIEDICVSKFTNTFTLLLSFE